MAYWTRIRLFGEADLSRVLATRRRECLQAIDAAREQDLLDNTVDELCEEYVARFSPVVPRLKEEEITREGPRDVQSEAGKAIQVTFFVPFEGDPLLFEFRPSRWEDATPIAAVHGGQLILTFLNSEADSESFRAELDNALSSIRRHLGNLKNDVKGFHDALRNAARSRIQQRRERARKNAEVAQSLGIPHRGERATEKTGGTPEDRQTRTEPKRGASVERDPRRVFVIYGRDKRIREAMFDFLRAIGLTPQEWPSLVKSTGVGSPYIGEVLEAGFARAQAVVALHTPDDEARLRSDLQGDEEPSYETQLTGQARPNVLFETGMAMGRDAGHTIIVEIGKLRPYSNIAGRHAIRLTNDAACRKELAQRLQSCGCPVDTEGNDWLNKGDFSVETP